MLCSSPQRCPHKTCLSLVLGGVQTPSVSRAQQGPSHSCVRCSHSTGPGMGPLGAVKGSPHCTCIHRSAAPVAASPHNILRCAFIPLAQTLEKRWGKPSLNTPTPAAVSLASLVVFFNQQLGAVQCRDPSLGALWSNTQSDLSQMLVDPTVLYSPPLTVCPAVCMHIRDTCTWELLPSSPSPVPSRYLVQGDSHLLQTWQVRTGNKCTPPHQNHRRTSLTDVMTHNGDWASWHVSCIRHDIFIIREPSVHIWGSADNEACNLVTKPHKPKDRYLCTHLPVAQGGGMQHCHL